MFVYMLAAEMLKNAWILIFFRGVKQVFNGAFEKIEVVKSMLIDTEYRCLSLHVRWTLKFRF